jgi:hypothetical protein
MLLVEEHLKARIAFFLKVNWEDRGSIQVVPAGLASSMVTA